MNRPVLDVMARDHLAAVLWAPTSDYTSADVTESSEAMSAVAELMAALADFDGMGDESAHGTPHKLARLRAAYRDCQGGAA